MSNDEFVNVKILYFDIRQNNFIRIIIVIFNMFNKWASQQQKKSHRVLTVHVTVYSVF